MPCPALKIFTSWFGIGKTVHSLPPSQEPKEAINYEENSPYIIFSRHMVSSQHQVDYPNTERHGGKQVRSPYHASLIKKKY